MITALVTKEALATFKGKTEILNIFIFPPKSTFSYFKNSK
jgi:hypothetical protein